MYMSFIFNEKDKKKLKLNSKIEFLKLSYCFELLCVLQTY